MATRRPGRRPPPTAALRSPATGSRRSSAPTRRPRSRSPAGRRRARRHRPDERHRVHVQGRRDQLASAPAPTPSPRRQSRPKPALAQYTSVVFSDGFESGNLSNWTGATQGTGTSSVADRGGARRRVRRSHRDARDAVRLLRPRRSSSPLTDSVDDLLDPARQRLAASRPSPRRATTRPSLVHVGARLRRHAPRLPLLPVPATRAAREIFTGNNSAASGAWIKVQSQYKADRGRRRRAALPERPDADRVGRQRQLQPDRRTSSDSSSGTRA